LKRNLTRFWSEEFFKEAGELLNREQDLTKVLTGMNTTILAECVDRNQAFLITVEDGKISSAEGHPEDKVEFRFAAPYDKWAKIARGEEKVQSEVVKGKIKFRGSMPKMLLYLGKVVRMEKKILKIIGEMELEY
jgi:putative sterol carrier protein